MRDDPGYGKEPGDLQAFLVSLSPQTTYAEEFRLARCGCGSEVFWLRVSRRQEVARRDCTQCKDRHWICDSGRYSKHSRTRGWQCPSCGGEEANVGVRFLVPEDRSWVDWITVGARCVDCGWMECPVGWKVRAGPAEPYLDGV